MVAWAECRPPAGPASQRRARHWICSGEREDQHRNGEFTTVACFAHFSMRRAAGTQGKTR
jgi:hypothetical protein